MTGFEPGQLSETASLGAALYCGILIGALYDVFRLIRLPLRNIWLTGLADMLYYAAAGCMAACTMLYINCGTFRLYIYLAMGLGILLYIRFPGRLIKAAVGKFTKKQLHPKK